MIFRRCLEKISLKDEGFDFKLKLTVGIFFLLPAFGFFWTAIRFGVWNNRYGLIFFSVILCSAFLGLIVLRMFYNEITSALKKELNQVNRELFEERFQPHQDELHSIARRLNTVDKKYDETIQRLDRKTHELYNLRDFSDSCHLTYDPEEILHIALERALALTDSDLGSVLLLDKKDRKSFLVLSSIGGEEFVKPGDRIDVETSIAKYAMINKSPLVVEDVEKDSRFGRKNRPRYGTKSFICMPVKTRADVLGVLTISRRNDKKPYTQKDIESLTTLVNTTAYTHENLLLLKDNDRLNLYINSIRQIFKVMNLNYQGSELLHVIFKEITGVMPFELALVLTRDEKRPNTLSILDLMDPKPSMVHRRDCSEFNGSVIDKTMKQKGVMFIDDTRVLTHEIEREFFVDRGCKSCLLAPLKMNGQITGVLALSSKNSDLHHAADVLIELVANTISFAIERNNLSASVNQRNQELNAIKQIGSTLASSTFDIKQVLNHTMDMIRLVMNVEAGSLYLVKDNELEFAAAFNNKAASQKKLRLKFGEGIEGCVASRGEPMIVNDARALPHFFSDSTDSADFTARSAMCVPMISQGKVVGVIEVENKLNSDFIASDKDLLQSIGASMSIAIDNANLYNETVSMAEQERGIRSMFQKFVPKEVLDEILHGSKIGKELIGELKILTFLNLDIRNFSDISRRLGSQKSVFLLNKFFSTMGEIVFKHNGIVDKYLGDGFLAVFGAPVSTSKDADNAVAAALEMQESLPGLNDYLIMELGASVSIGISVHTGEAVVGNIGFEMKMDYTVIGDSVNDVFRLQELTKPILNGILISENTSRACRSRLELLDLDGSICRHTSLHGMKIYELLSIDRDCQHAA